MNCPDCKQSDEFIQTKPGVFECERCKIEFWFESDEEPTE